MTDKNILSKISRNLRKQTTFELQSSKTSDLSVKMNLNLKKRTLSDYSAPRKKSLLTHIFNSISLVLSLLICHKQSSEFLTSFRYRRNLIEGRRIVCLLTNFFSIFGMTYAFIVAEWQIRLGINNQETLIQSTKNDTGVDYTSTHPKNDILFPQPSSEMMEKLTNNYKDNENGIVYNTGRGL